MTTDIHDMLGWVPFDDRTAEMNAAHDFAVARMPAFAIAGAAASDDVTQARLFDVWTHADTVAALGRPFTGVWQQTGSCVGAGGGNVLFTLAAIEVIRLNDPEKIVVPFWLLPYGKSRQRGGMRGRGEGSFGSTFADACKLDGVIDAAAAGLPQPQWQSDCVTWGKAAELAWSDGAAVSEAYLAESRKHLVGTVAPCRSAAEVKAALCNNYPVTNACDRIIQSASKIVGGAGRQVLLGAFDGRGGHQTSYLGFWLHPDEGPLYWNMNQWPRSMYGKCPSGAPAGGCWVKEAEVDWVCRNGEVYAFSQFNGFPGVPRPVDPVKPNTIPWIF